MAEEEGVIFLCDNTIVSATSVNHKRPTQEPGSGATAGDIPTWTRWAQYSTRRKHDGSTVLQSWKPLPPINKDNYGSSRRPPMRIWQN
jgi:hypothetical protein